MIISNPDLALIVEFRPMHLSRAERKIEEWFGKFDRLGLIYCLINHESGNIQQIELKELMNIASANLLFARPESSVWGRLA